jgi:hypothetical protein
MYAQAVTRQWPILQGDEVSPPPWNTSSISHDAIPDEHPDHPNHQQCVNTTSQCSHCRYVDNLLRAAGTFDDMKVLKSFVASQCRVKIQSKRVDDGE